MGTRIIMPSGGQTTNESLVTGWNKQIGDTVHRGDVLFSIETDKATMDVESYGEGILLAIYHGADEMVSAGELMAFIGKEGETVPSDGKQPEPASHPSSGPTDARAPAAGGEDEYQPIPQTYQETKTSSGKLLASPAARKLAADNGLDLTSMADASTPQPVKKAQVQQWIDRLASANGGPLAKPIAGEDFYTVEASTMRRTIARRMAESVSKAPQYTVGIEVDMGSAIALREKLNHQLMNAGINISYNDIIMKCACAAIKKNPIINATYQFDTIKIYRNVHFGLAVGLEDGLIVPVVRYANNKTIAQIAMDNALNIQKAKAGKLQQDELAGSTITLSNLGMFGVSGFTAILNHPESCILAVGGIQEKPVVRNGALAIGSMMSITATFDHRLIDGAAGASFLREVKLLLENPEFLLITE